jgi:hypothetical protein
MGLALGKPQSLEKYSYSTGFTGELELSTQSVSEARQHIRRREVTRVYTHMTNSSGRDICTERWEPSALSITLQAFVEPRVYNHVYNSPLSILYCSTRMPPHFRFLFL